MFTEKFRKNQRFPPRWVVFLLKIEIWKITHTCAVCLYACICPNPVKYRSTYCRLEPTHKYRWLG